MFLRNGRKKTTHAKKNMAKVVFDEKLVKICQRCSSANSWVVSLLKRRVVCNNDETRRRRDGHLPRQCTRWASHLGDAGRPFSRLFWESHGFKASKVLPRRG